MVQVHQHMENAGVSVELIFDLRKIAACLARMESILDVLTAEGEQARIAAVHGLLGQLMEGRLYDLSLIVPASRKPEPDRPQDGGAHRP